MQKIKYFFGIRAYGVQVYLHYIKESRNRSTCAARYCYSTVAVRLTKMLNIKLHGVQVGGSCWNKFSLIL